MPDPYNPWATPIFPGASAFGVGSPAEDAQRQPTIVDNLLSHIAGALGRGFMAPGQALQSTTPITSEQMIAPAQDMSTAMSTGAGAMPASANELRMGIKAYHGSPHDFERFDLSKIGTGEGAQAYGHGLYFADSEGVARSYRDALASRKLDWNTPEAAAKYDPGTLAALEKDLRNKSPDEVMAMNKQYADHANETGRRTIMADMHDALKNGDLNKGRMYEVNINADPAHFLDWDKPLLQQPQAVQNLSASHPELKRYFDLAPEARGDVAYNQGLGGGSKAAETLREAGIPGIKYLDQGSRTNVNVNDIRGSLSMWEKALSKTPNDPYAAQQVADLQKQLATAEKGGTSNYVVFNDKLIDILRKYAVPGMMGAPIFANSIGEQKS